MKKYNVTTIELSFKDLSTIIEGLYYGGEDDLSHTEDLIQYLHDHPNMAAQLEIARPAEAAK